MVWIATLGHNGGENMELDTRVKEAKNIIREELEEPLTFTEFLFKLCIGVKKKVLFFEPTPPIALTSFHEDHVDITVFHRFSNNKWLMDKLSNSLTRAEKRLENYNINLIMN